MAKEFEGSIHGDALEALLHEHRFFAPSAEFAAQANAQPSVYEDASDAVAWWDHQARSLQWDTTWDATLDWELPFAKWFVGGKLNVSVNCVDRHVDAGPRRPGRVPLGGRAGRHPDHHLRRSADRWCARPPTRLTELGVKAGDRVAIYMPMIPETVVAMLACARLGAPHSVVFGGFSADALRTGSSTRDARLRHHRRRRLPPRRSRRRSSPNVDEAVEECPDVEHVLVVRRTGQDVAWDEARDHVVARPRRRASPRRTSPRRSTPSTRSTSCTRAGTTAKPKGILHTTGGYLTHVAATHRLIFDLKPETDVFWTAADIGWVTGHSYIVYGPLANGTTSVMYEGTPDTPDARPLVADRREVQGHILYTAPTTIRTFMKWGEDLPAAHDLSSLRLLGSVGEPINPEAWIWYRTHIGGDAAPSSTRGGRPRPAAS